MIIIYQNRGLLRLDANHSHPNQIIWLQHCVSFNWTSYPHSHYNTWILSVISSRNCAHRRLIAGVSWVVFSIGCFWRERKSANEQCYLGLGIQCQMLPHLSNSSYQLIRYIIKAWICFADQYELGSHWFVLIRLRYHIHSSWNHIDPSWTYDSSGITNLVHAISHHEMHSCILNLKRSVARICLWNNIFHFGSVQEHWESETFGISYSTAFLTWDAFTILLYSFTSKSHLRHIICSPETSYSVAYLAWDYRLSPSMRRGWPESVLVTVQNALNLQPWRNPIHLQSLPFAVIAIML